MAAEGEIEVRYQNVQNISDTNFEEPEEFQPLRDPGEPSSYCETRTHYIGHILSFHR